MTVSVISLRQAGCELGKDPKYLKGVAEGIGIRLEPVAKSLLMTHKDFDRLRVRLDEIKSASSAVAPPR